MVLSGMKIAPGSTRDIESCGPVNTHVSAGERCDRVRTGWVVDIFDEEGGREMMRKRIVIGMFVFVIAPLLAITVSCLGDRDDNASSIGQSPVESAMASTQEPPLIHYFTISPEAGPVGSWFLFSWETEGVDRVTIEPTITSIQLPPSGSVAGKVIYSTWFTLIAEASGVTTTARAWVQVSHPEGSMWGFPRADTSNSNFSRWPGPTTNNLKWTYPLMTDHPDGEISLTLGGDNAVYVSKNYGSWFPNADYLCVINPDGTKKSNKYAPVSQQVIDASGTIYGSINTDRIEREQLIALNPDGTEKWVLDSNPYNSSSYVCGRQIYLDQQENLVVFDSCYNPGEAWQLIYRVSSSGVYMDCLIALYSGIGSLAINADGSIVVGFWDRLYFFSGSMDNFWIVQDAQLQYYGTPITDVNCRVYSCFLENSPLHSNYYYHGVMAIDHLGNEIWRVFFPDALNQTGVVMARSERAVYVVLNSSTNHLLSLCAIHLGGWLLWTVPLEELSSYPYTHVVVDGEDRTYVSLDDYIYSFDRDGSLCWQAHPGKSIKAMALSRDRTLYASDGDHVFAFGDENL